MMAILAVPLIGAMGFAAESTNWFLTKRAEQNAADSAAIAASTNNDNANSPAGTTFRTEALAVASNYGFVNGANNTTVTVTPGVTCPSPLTTSNCYQVTITRNLPIYLVRAVGFQGDVALNGGRAKTITATAISSPQATGQAFCVLALSQGAAGISTSGAPKVVPAGCHMMSNSSTSCSGHTVADYVDAHGTSDPVCAVIKATSNAPLVSDASYRALASNIPTTGCVAPPANLTALSSSSYCFSSDWTLSNDVVVNSGSGGTVLTMTNSGINLHGHRLYTNSGSGLTIVFTGNTGTHNVTGTGTLDIAAPAAGSGSPWQGIALYQEATMTSGVNINYGGSSPAWKISGLIYAPQSDFQLQGSVGQSTNGLSCFDLIVKTFSLKGSAQIYDNSQLDCVAAGVSSPTAPGTGNARQGLVQ